MKSPIFRLFSVIGLIFTFFAAIEFAAELRAISRGWEGPWIESVKSVFDPLTVSAEKGRSQNDLISGQIAITRSPFVPKDRDPAKPALRMAVMGSSQCEDPKFSIQELWVNQMGDRLREIGQKNGSPRLRNVEIINASWAGSTLISLYPRLKWILEEYQPDLVILYEMSNTINQYSQKIRGRSGSEAEGKNQSNSGGSTTEVQVANYSLMSLYGIREKFAKTFGETVVYAYLKATLGVQTVAFMSKVDGLGSIGEKWYLSDLQDLLNLCRKHNAQLVLSDFLTIADNCASERASSHIRECFRYNTLLSEQGWSNTLSRFNQIGREFSDQERLPFLSARRTVRCTSECFRDFSHFTEQGHKLMGKAMADSIAKQIVCQTGEARK